MHTECLRCADVNKVLCAFLFKGQGQILKACLYVGLQCQLFLDAGGSNLAFGVTHVRNKKSNIQGRSPVVVKSDFPFHKELLLKERIRSPWEQILSFKRGFHFENGRKYRKSLLDPVVAL